MQNLGGKHSVLWAIGNSQQFCYIGMYRLQYLNSIFIDSLLLLLLLLFFKALCDSIHSGYVHTLAHSFLCQHKKLFSVVWTSMMQKQRKLFTHIKHCGGPARGGRGGRSHVAHLNFKTSGVGVYNCLSLIVGFAVTVAIWPREVVSCRDFILCTAATFWAMSLVGIYPGRA